MSTENMEMILEVGSERPTSHLVDVSIHFTQHTMTLCRTIMILDTCGLPGRLMAQVR